MLRAARSRLIMGSLRSLKSLSLTTCSIRLKNKEQVEDTQVPYSGKSATIRESNHGSGVCKEHYV